MRLIEFKSISVWICFAYFFLLFSQKIHAGFMTYHEAILKIEDSISSIADTTKRGIEQHKFKQWKARIEQIRQLSQVASVEHPVVISITSSPERLKHVPTVLSLIQDQITKDYIKKVIIVLPEKFRDNMDYNPEDIQPLSNLHEKVEVQRISKDLGPITKIIPAIEWANKHMSSGKVLSIDDDIAYSPSLVHVLAQAAHEPETVSSGGGSKKQRWNIPEDFPQQLPHHDSKSANYVDVIEGYGGVLYPLNINTELMKALVDPKFTSQSCKLSDDLVISFVLAIQNIYRVKASGSLVPIFHIPYGNQADALHSTAPSDLLITDLRQVDAIKYQDCYKKLREVSYDHEHKKFKTTEEIMAAYHQKIHEYVEQSSAGCTSSYSSSPDPLGHVAQQGAESVRVVTGHVLQDQEAEKK